MGRFGWNQRSMPLGEVACEPAIDRADQLLIIEAPRHAVGQGELLRSFADGRELAGPNMPNGGLTLGTIAIGAVTLRVIDHVSVGPKQLPKQGVVAV